MYPDQTYFKCKNCLNFNTPNCQFVPGPEDIAGDCFSYVNTTVASTGEDVKINTNFETNTLVATKENVDRMLGKTVPEWTAKHRVDNLDQILELLTFESDDDYYLLQVIKRRKENPDMSQGECVVSTVYITSKEKLIKLHDMLKALAVNENARIYINLNVKSLKKTTLLCMKEIAERVVSNDYKRAYRMFDSCAGKCGASRDKRWIIDVDYETIKEGNVQDVIELIDNCQPLDTEKIIAKIPTVNGVHLITKPFNLLEFRRKYKESEIQIHKNNPTLLFYGRKDT